MGSFLRPVGPQPAAVYWRRRIVVVGVPLVLVALIAYSCASPSPTNGRTNDVPVGATAGPSALITVGPQASSSVQAAQEYPAIGPTASADHSADPAAGGAAAGSATADRGTGTAADVASGCDLAIAVTTDKAAYASGQNPVFTVSLANNGAANCIIAANGLVVTVALRGSDGAEQPVWNSGSCQATAGSEYAVGTSPLQLTFPWSRQESLAGCPAAPPGAPTGQYLVVATANGVSSAAADFTLS